MGVKGSRLLLVIDILRGMYYGGGLDVLLVTENDFVDENDENLDEEFDNCLLVVMH
jgi:hypothetical protein